MHNIDIKEIIEIVREAGKIAMDFYHRDYDVEEKENKTPVTEADLAVNAYLCDALEKYNIPILSEENEDSSERLASEYVWVIDPIDGTKDFIQRTGEFTIMLGLVHQYKSVMGFVYAPVTDELFWAKKSMGAFKQRNHETQELHVSERALDKARILVSRNHLGKQEQEIAQKYSMEKISMGSGGLKISRIAEGSAEIYINSSDKGSEWDVCAADIILSEAGGIMKAFHTQEDLMYNQKDVILRDGYIALHDVSLKDHFISQ